MMHSIKQPSAHLLVFDAKLGDLLETPSALDFWVCIRYVGSITHSPLYVRIYPCRKCTGSLLYMYFLDFPLRELIVVHLILLLRNK